MKRDRKSLTFFLFSHLEEASGPLRLEAIGEKKDLRVNKESVSG